MESFDIDNIDWEEVKEYFSNLKNWFSLENYDYIKRLSRWGIAEIIKDKELLYNVNKKYPEINAPSFWLGVLENRKYKYKLNQNDPDMGESKEYDDRAMTIMAPEKHIALFREIYNSIDNQTPKKQLLEAIKEQDIDKYLQIMLINYRDSLPEVKICDTAYLEIDLTYSDEAIINSLKKKLPKIREQAPLQYKNPRKISDTGIHNLLDQKIIPCMDLLLWQRLTGKKLTDQEMLDLISPYGKVGLDSFRNTIKKKAKEILNGEYKKFA